MREICVIVPTHNPEISRLRRCLNAIQNQSLSSTRWECLIIDNASKVCVQDILRQSELSDNFRIIRENSPGLTSARRCGFQASSSEIVVMVDDDNLLAPDYLAHVLATFETQPRVGAAGGRSLPEFETEPEPWMREFEGLLACRNLGEKPLISNAPLRPTSGKNEYPLFAPIGAGMAIRRSAIQSWLAQPPFELLPDRCGDKLTSGGDNEMIFTILQSGWKVGYFPELELIHVIPSSRLDCTYLGRLNEGIQYSWIQVLHKYGASPWHAIPAWSIPLRQLKAWVTHRAWSGPAEWVRWKGACGMFSALGNIA